MAGSPTGTGREDWELRDQPGTAERELVHPTSAPIAEEERGTGAPRGGPSRFGALSLLGGAIAVIVAVLAAVLAGPIYAVPVAVLAALVLAFVGLHRYLGLKKTRTHGDAARDAVADDASDPVPHFGFDEATDVGSGPEHAADDSSEHGRTDAERSAT